MVSIGNKAKLVTSEECQSCGKCCKVFDMTCDINCGLRFLWIDSKRIKARDTAFRMPYDGGMEKSIKFKFPCTQLEFKDRKYKCKMWDKERPEFCNNYPDSIFYDTDIWNEEKIEKLIDESKEDCPAMRHITIKDVIKMLEER